MKHEFERYCKEPEKIENYEKAKKDNFKGWECHHRLETHTSEGERRDADIPQKELKALGMYYNRPPEELIFLTIREHHAFKKGKYTGENNPFYGKKHSEESKKKNRDAHKGKPSPNKGKHFTAEHRKRLSEASKDKNTWIKGTRWFNNGKISKRAYECPPGFVSGRLRK